MAPIWSTFFFAAAAAAQITTSMWIPSPHREDETYIGFYASVVGVSDGKTTLALQFDDKTDLQTAGYIVNDKPNTITFDGSSRFESVTTTTEGSNGPALTVMYGCEMKAGTGALCAYSSNGPAMHTSSCAQYSHHTKAHSHCESGSTIPESVVVSTYVIEKSDIATYQVVITAGEEKLSATADAAAPTEAPIMTLPAITLQQQGQSVVPTATESAPAVATGAAGAVLPLHPALAGLGAAAMAFLI